MLVTSHTTRLFAYVARDVRTAVVVRRGPSKQVRMILWDLATDTFTRGQWLSGRLYNDKCGISPNGRLFIYFTAKFKTKLGTFTAVCRPPNFTALALWPDGSSYGGGGFFESNRKVVLNYARVIDEINENASVPDDFEVTHLGDFRTRHGELSTCAHHGWTCCQRGKEGEPTEKMRYVFAEPWIFRKPCPRRHTLMLEQHWLGMFEVNGPSSVYAFRLIETAKHGAQTVEDLGRLDWAGWDHDGSLLFSRDGAMFRRDLSRPLKHASVPTKLEDFSDDTFESILPTDDAKRWP